VIPIPLPSATDRTVTEHYRRPRFILPRAFRYKLPAIIGGPGYESVCTFPSRLVFDRNNHHRCPGSTIDPGSFSALKWRLVGPLAAGASLPSRNSGQPAIYYFGTAGGGFGRRRTAGAFGSQSLTTRCRIDWRHCARASTPTCLCGHR